VNPPEAVIVKREVTCAVCTRAIVGPASAWLLGGRVFVHTDCVVDARITNYTETRTVACRFNTSETTTENR